MKPLNLDNKPCAPISSNCVIWQGPDIECITLCTGDTVSDAVNKLATELCTIFDQLKISSYDLTCLGITAACPPANFEALIQLLITKICALENVSVVPPEGKSGCPDCVVSVAECFVVGTTTTMQLIDYVQAIASRVCSLVDSITDLQVQIDNIDIRVTALEDAVPPSLTLPDIPTGCFALYPLGTPTGTPAAIDVVLDLLVNDPDIGYCTTISALYGSGTAADILSVVNPACITGASNSVVSGLTTAMSVSYPAWVGVPATLVNTINNLWIAVCDLRNITTVSFTDTATIDFTQNTGLPNYDFSAEIIQPKALATARGTNITNGANIIFSSGLNLTKPGYVPTPITTPAGNANAAMLCANSMKITNAGLTEEYNTFSVSPFAVPGVATIPEDGLYDIGFSIRISAPVTTVALPSPPAVGLPFGVGKGWYGGDSVSSDDGVGGITITVGGTTYTEGIYAPTGGSGSGLMVYITVAGGVINGFTILNAGTGYLTSDLTAALSVPGGDGAGRFSLDSLTSPTPKITVIAGINVAGAGCDTVCYDVFTSNNSVSQCYLESSRLGVQLTATTQLELSLAILVNDEDPAVAGNPNPLWNYNIGYFDATDRAEFFIRKMGPLLP